MNAKAKFTGQYPKEFTWGVEYTESSHHIMSKYCCIERIFETGKSF